MTLLLTMLPLYLAGNLHCLGMCGPLAMTLGRHPYRFLYLLGRLVSFSGVAMLAAELGASLDFIIRQWQIPALTSLVFGLVIFIVGLFSFVGWGFPGKAWFGRQTQGLNQRLTLLSLQDGKLPIFLFGFFTVFLPCGQTIIVFSACALSADPFVGLLNGFAFAVLTSPSLLAAMHAQRFLGQAKAYYNQVMGGLAMFVGTLALCRGMAELGFLEHWILNPNSPGHLHIVLY